MDSKKIDERISSLEKQLDELKRNKNPDRKDLWDKISSISGFLSGLLIAIIGTYATATYNNRQLDAQNIQKERDYIVQRTLTIEKFFPHFASDIENIRQAALQTVAALDKDLAIALASQFGGQSGTALLVHLAESKDQEISKNAAKALYENQISIINNATKQLGAEKDGEIDLEERLAGINTIRLLASGNPPEDYYRMAADVLINYIRINLPTRKKESYGVEKIWDAYRPEDIIAAFKALQSIRKNSDGKVSIQFKAFDFDNVSLEGLDMEGFDFRLSSFQKALLSKSIMRNADFTLADLSYAAIWNADMSYANFHKTKLYQTKFANVLLEGSNIEEASDKNVALFGAIGLSKEQIALFPRFDQ